MTPARRRQIHRLAEYVRKSVGVSHGFPLESVAEKLGGALTYEQFENGAEGRIVKRGKGFVISIPKEARGTARERFTFAHELGHLYVHLGYQVDPERWESTTSTYEDTAYHRFGHSAEELDANEFAAAFLMPESEFREVAREHRNEDGYDIGAIARHFHVSRDAARLRGQWLGLFAWW